MGVPERVSEPKCMGGKWWGIGGRSIDKKGECQMYSTKVRSASAHHEDVFIDGYMLFMQVGSTMPAAATGRAPSDNTVTHRASSSSLFVSRCRLRTY